MGLIFVCLASLAMGAVGFAVADFRYPGNSINVRIKQFAHWVGCESCREEYR